jgi:hypothetical protein
MSVIEWNCCDILDIIIKTTEGDFNKTKIRNRYLPYADPSRHELYAQSEHNLNTIIFPVVIDSKK